MKQWQITWAKHKSNELDELLEQGWEPFAVTEVTITGTQAITCIWLRKEVKSETKRD